ncbi:MAG: hypothetical protein JNK63_05055 [Chthonomonas sp.]|nr:hypothetical protein [Chthonomonas sp.]
MRPDASVVIKQDSGSELVNISMLDPNYPVSLLQQQIGNLGSEVGVPARGIMVFAQQYGESESQRIVKAQFAVNGLMNRVRGEVNLQAVVRMFAGAPSPYTVNVVQVILDGETPQERTLRTYSNEGVVVSGTSNSNPNTIEYLIQLKTQDKTKIEIPLSHIPEEKPAEKPKPEPGLNTNLLIALIVLASIAAGALVYFLMVGRSPNR